MRLLFISYFLTFLLHRAQRIACSFVDADKEAFVLVHNRLRQTAAPTASDMRMITWSRKLEQLAIAKVVSCVFEHSYAGEYANLGENLASSSRTNPTEITMTWFTEKTNHQTNNGQATGHYTQIMFSPVTEIGCAIKRDCQQNVHLTSCLYSLTSGGATWTVGPQCSRCPPEAPFCLYGLCVSADDPNKFQIVKLLDSAGISALDCRLACENCGQRVAPPGLTGCSCKCGAEAEGNFCEKRKADSTAKCSPCTESPACLNGGSENTADPSKCQCNCKSGFVGARCEVAQEVQDSSVRIVIGAAKEFLFNNGQFKVFPPASRSLFNSKMWPTLKVEFSTAVNEFCRADSANYARCCPGKTFPGSDTVAKASHLSSDDVKLIESAIANSPDGSLGVRVYASVSSSSTMCPGNSTYVPQAVLLSALQPKMAALSATLAACCDDFNIKEIGTGEEKTDPGIKKGSSGTGDSDVPMTLALSASLAVTALSAAFWAL